jgi:hypothetical protein
MVTIGLVSPDACLLFISFHQKSTTRSVTPNGCDVGPWQATFPVTTGTNFSPGLCAASTVMCLAQGHRETDCASQLRF